MNTSLYVDNFYVFAYAMGFCFTIAHAQKNQLKVPLHGSVESHELIIR